MKNKCIHKDLIFYLDNELSVEKRRDLEKHLEGCADCRGFLAFLQEGMQIIEKEKNQEPSPYFFTRLSARMDDRPAFKPQAWPVRLVQPAIFSLLLIVGIYGGLQLGRSASSGSIQPASSGGIQLMNDFDSEPIETFLLDEL